MTRTRRLVTPAERAEILARYPHEPTEQLAREYGRSIGTLYSWASIAGIHKPYQIGKRRAARTGRTAERPLGTESIRDGYLMRKVATRSASHLRWRRVHVLVWEAAHGPVPAGCVIRFKPGRFSTRHDDITLDALECVTQAENMARNSMYRYGTEVADLIRLRGTLTREVNRSNKNG